MRRGKSEPIFFVVLDAMDANTFDARRWVAPDQFRFEGRNALHGDTTGAFRGERKFVNTILRRISINKGNEFRVDPAGRGGFRTHARDDLRRLCSI